MKFHVILCFLPTFCFSKFVEEEISDHVLAGNKSVEVRIIGITEPDAAAPKDEQQQELQFINDGFCHWNIKNWYKPGSHVRCNCMKCTCGLRGKWNCTFSFNYCPYFYCGNEIYNPSTELCCCGKKYTKRENFQCCGYFYYNSKTSRCCHFYSVRPLKATCPRYQV